MKVAVLAGGRSSEHDVSLNSGASVAAGLAEYGHEVVDVRLHRDGTWHSGGAELSLQPGRGLLGVDCAFPVLHGPFGEDGTVQGLLELLDVPYVGSAVMASAVCMDKVVFKQLMAREGLSQVAFALVARGSRHPTSATPAGSSPRGWARVSGSPRSPCPRRWARRSRSPSRTTHG